MTTIGVSVPVPDPWGADLQRYRVALGDDDAAGIPTHITLLPPIDVEDHLLPEIADHLQDVAQQGVPYPVRLRGTGTFRPVSPVVFLNVVQGISCCEVLASAVRRGPLAVETQFPYHPHVTVAHHLDEDVLDKAFDDLGDYDLAFGVDRFVLYHHEDDRGWVPQRDFLLTGSGQGD
jgi:2'-5' RNA ligase